MALDKIVGGVVIVAAVGIGAAVLGPGLLQAARPSLRKALARGIALARESQKAAEAAWEDFEDIVAEAAADVKHAATAPASSVAPFARAAPEGSVSTSVKNGNGE